MPCRGGRADRLERTVPGIAVAWPGSTVAANGPVRTRTRAKEVCHRLWTVDRA
ncbi:hypothetical protein [Natronorubrum halophilum]|uniref:hypothetical protein n=1 Tax=Natronorubrum halophilum TaxID=1702106 RepID=UPI0013CE471F|nr:hypothetical protein [Natronorubrum halophilum]